MGLDISEVPDSPRRRDLSFFLVALLLVAPLRAVAPLSWAFVLYALRSGSIWSFTWKGKLAFALALCELFFSVYHYRLAAVVSAPWTHGTGKSGNEILRHACSPMIQGNIAQLQVAFARVLKTGLANLPEDGYDEESLDVDRPASPVELITQLDFNDPRSIDFRNVLRTVSFIFQFVHLADKPLQISGLDESLGLLSGG
jgi:hypothetical protein